MKSFRVLAISAICLLSFSAIKSARIIDLAIGQNLLTERIWKISPRKRSIFFDQGVFHSDLPSLKNKLLSIRNSYKSDQKYRAHRF